MDSLLDEQVHYKVIQVEKEVYALRWARGLYPSPLPSFNDFAQCPTSLHLF